MLNTAPIDSNTQLITDRYMLLQCAAGNAGDGRHGDGPMDVKTLTRRWFKIYCLVTSLNQLPVIIIVTPNIGKIGLESQQFGPDVENIGIGPNPYRHVCMTA